MLVYHLLIIMCFCAAVLNSRKRLIENEAKKRKELNVFFAVIVVYMILICGLRAYDRIYHIGIDTYGYFRSYESVTERYKTLTDIFAADGSDKGYDVLYWILNKIGFNYAIVSVIFSAIYVGIIGAFIYKYSKNVLMSLLVFAGLGLYIFAFSAIRQSLAMGLCLLGYMMDDKKKGIKGFVWFAVLLWVATTIHTSAIIFSFAYILGKLPLKKSLVFIMIIVALIAMLFKRQYAGLIQNIAENISDKYANYGEKQLVEEQNAGTKLYIFVAAVLALRLIFSNRFSGDKKDNSLVYMMLFMLILFPAVQGGGAIMRIYFYYYIFIVVFIPNTIESMRRPADRAMMYMLFIGFLLYYYLTSVLTGVTLTPYRFFWETI